ncbi:MAG: hypothetical protein R3Y09_11220 [Clostridia bacterium]
MKKLTLEQIYYGDEYNIYGKCLAEFIMQDKSDTIAVTNDDLMKLFRLTVKYTAQTTIQMIKQGDFISELETEMKSLSVLERGAK